MHKQVKLLRYSRSRRAGIFRLPFAHHVDHCDAMQDRFTGSLAIVHHDPLGMAVPPESLTHKALGGTEVAAPR